MKISEMETKQAAQCICRIAQPIGRIGEDKEIAAYLKTLGGRKGEPVIALISGAIAKLLPVLLDAHYEDAVEILSAMTGKSKEEIGSQNVLITMRDAKECVDKDLIDFFIASRNTGGEK